MHLVFISYIHELIIRFIIWSLWTMFFSFVFVFFDLFFPPSSLLELVFTFTSCYT